MQYTQNQDFSYSRTVFRETEYKFYCNCHSPNHFLYILWVPEAVSMVLWGYLLFNRNKPSQFSQVMVKKKCRSVKGCIQIQLECLAEITFKIRSGWKEGVKMKLFKSIDHHRQNNAHKCVIKFRVKQNGTVTY